MKRKWMLTAMAGFAVVIAMGLMLAMSGGRLHSKARKEWKHNAIREISVRVGDIQQVEAEVLEMREKVDQAGGDSEAWLSDHLIVAANGDWIVFSSKCSKEDRRIHDIFLGRASDGKWYYSTYHFCIGMLTLRMEEQPADLVAFVNTYFLREFDGHSDECLSKTWPPDQR